jgi:hypothetical protein
MSSALRRTVPPLPGTRCSEGCIAGGVIHHSLCSSETMDSFVDYTNGFHVQLESRTADCSFRLSVFIHRTSLRVRAIAAVTESNRVPIPKFRLIRTVSIYSLRLVSLVD